MKFDPTAWREVKAGEKVAAGKGWVRVRASAPSALYVETLGKEALFGVGTSFDVQVSTPVSVRLDSPPETRAFIETAGDVTAVVPTGEVFTNIDRMPEESGMLADVQRAKRELEMMRRRTLREIRDAAAEARKPRQEHELADPGDVDQAPEVVDEGDAK